MNHLCCVINLQNQFIVRVRIAYMSYHNKIPPHKSKTLKKTAFLVKVLKGH